MTSLLLDDREKNIFQDWLLQREKVLTNELEILKGLQVKLQTGSVVEHPVNQDIEIKAISRSTASKKEETSSSWVHIIKSELKHFTHPIPSGEIVKRLLHKPTLSEKGKRFITKAVTSKLWLLQERGEVVKSRENGKYVYILKQK